MARLMTSGAPCFSSHRCLKSSTTPSKDSPPSSPQIAQTEEQSKLQTSSQYSRSIHPGNMRLSYRVQGKRGKKPIFSLSWGREEA